MIWFGEKPSTLRTAISVRRSRTLMLMALEITRAMVTRMAGTSSQRMPQSRSR